MRKFLATTLLLVLAATLTACPPAAVEKPVISAFTSDVTGDKLPVGGGNVTLSWTTTGASEVNLSAVPATPAPVLGANKVTAVVSGVKETTTFTLTAKNSAGDTVTKTKTITVTALAAPTITKFMVKTATIAETNNITLPVGGGAVTFVSSVTGAASLTIDKGVGAVTPLTGGNTAFAAPTAGVYTLTATNATGTDTATVTINITPPTPANIVSSVPASGATGVAIDNNTIVVNFDKAMNTATTQAAFTSTSVPTTPTPDFVWSNGDKTLTITSASLPNAPAAVGVNKVVTYNFATTATDSTGTPLAVASTAARTYTTLKAVLASLVPDPTLSGTIIFTNGVDPAPAGQPATCGGAGLPVCAQNEYSLGEYRIGDSSANVNGKVANPNNAYKGFAGFNLASLTTLTPANLISANFSMTQNGAPPSSGTPYVLGTMKLQSISSVDLATIPINAAGTPNSFLYYTATANSAVNFSDAAVGLKTISVKAELTADLTGRVARGNRALFRLMFPKIPAVVSTFDGATDADGLEDIADFSTPKLEIVYTQP
jgi:hypothetical protein